MVEYLKTEDERELLKFVDGVEVPGIRCGIQDTVYFAWVISLYRTDKRNTYSLSFLPFDEDVVCNLLNEGSHVPLGFDYSGKVVLLTIDPPLPSSSVSWKYKRVEIPGDLPTLTQDLAALNPIPQGMRGIVDFDTLHLFVPVPVQPIRIPYTYALNRFKPASAARALSDIAALIADGHVFFDFDPNGNASYLEVTPIAVPPPRVATPTRRARSPFQRSSTPTNLPSATATATSTAYSSSSPTRSSRPNSPHQSQKSTYQPLVPPRASSPSFQQMIGYSSSAATASSSSSSSSPASYKQQRPVSAPMARSGSPSFQLREYSTTSSSSTSSVSYPTGYSQPRYITDCPPAQPIAPNGMTTTKASLGVQRGGYSIVGGAGVTMKSQPNGPTYYSSTSSSTTSYYSSPAQVRTYKQQQPQPQPPQQPPQRYERYSSFPAEYDTRCTVNTVDMGLAGIPTSEEGIRRLFDRLDTNRNGYLTKDEFKQFYFNVEWFGLEPTEEEVDTLLRGFNALDDELISYEEFAILCLKLSRR